MKAVREMIVLIILWLMTVAAAFQAGVIWELKGLDSAQKRLTRLESEQGRLAGEIESHKAMLRGVGKGRMPRIP